MNSKTLLSSLLCCLLVWGMAPAAWAQLQVKRSLVAYYPMNGNATDYSGNLNDGQMLGGMSRTFDRHGQDCGALAFDGQTGYISVKSSNSLQDFSDQLSLSVWMRMDGAGLNDLEWLTLVCKGSDDEEKDNMPQFRVQLTKVTVSINTDMTENINIGWNLGQWYHVVLTYNGREVTLYKDGSRLLSVPYYTSFNKNREPLEIGRDRPGVEEFFHGALDDLALYNRALTPYEVQLLYKDTFGATVAVPKECMPPPPMPNKPPVQENPGPSPNPNINEEPINEPADTPVQQAPVPATPTPSAPIPGTTPGNPNPSTVPTTNTPQPNPTPVANNPAPEPEPEPVDPDPVIPLKDTTGVNPKINAKIQKTVIVKNPNITIYLYDNQKKDGDIVSVSFNGKWIVEQHKLKKKGGKLSKVPEFKTTLKEGQDYYLISRAWNTGKIPPNTLRVEIFEEGRKHPQAYEIHSLPYQDGGLRLIYKPDKP